MRFFVYWKQRERRTDYDLSVLLLDDDFEVAGQVSWTNLSELGAVHSGDITEAPDGATEFIDLDLGRVSARYVVPQVNVYSGEGFDDAEEAFFGFMERAPEQRGRPFEPRTVRAKSDLFGTGARVAAGALRARRRRRLARQRGCTSACAGTRSSTASRATAQHVAARARDRRAPLPAHRLPRALLRCGTTDGAPAHLSSASSAPRTFRPDAIVYTPANLPELLNSA